MTDENEPAGRLSPTPSSDRASLGRARRGPVLVVDDDDQHRLSLAMALTDEGYEVAEASDGNAAIDYLLRHRTPSVILLDLIMPTLSGWDVLNLLRRYLRFNRIPVIIVTGQPATVQVPGANVVARVQKPVPLEDLLHLLEDRAAIVPRR